MLDPPLHKFFSDQSAFFIGIIKSVRRHITDNNRGVGFFLFFNSPRVCTSMDRFQPVEFLNYFKNSEKYL